MNKKLSWMCFSVLLSGCDMTSFSLELQAIDSEITVTSDNHLTKVPQIINPDISAYSLDKTDDNDNEDKLENQGKSLPSNKKKAPVLGINYVVNHKA